MTLSLLDDAILTIFEFSPLAIALAAKQEERQLMNEKMAKGLNISGTKKNCSLQRNNSAQDQLPGYCCYSYPLISVKNCLKIYDCVLYFFLICYTMTYSQGYVTCNSVPGEMVSETLYIFRSTVVQLSSG